jgi:hypothetical protein
MEENFLVISVVSLMTGPVRKMGKGLLQEDTLAGFEL